MAGTPILQTTLKTIELLEVLTRFGTHAPLASVAEALGWSRSATHQYLASLARMGWVEQDHERRYRLGSGAVLFARSIVELEFLPHPITDAMDELVDVLKEPISFAVLHGEEAVIVERREPRRSLIHRNPERHLSLVSASGQVLLAFDRRAQALRSPEHAALIEEVERTGHGEVRNTSWMGDDIEAIAVPVMRGDWCLGALSVIAPAGRMSLEDAASELKKAARKIELELAEFPA
jgi:DNA-binding IclR family transcriptional regulator